MYCPQCGVENSDGASFCQSCGTSLTPIVEQPVPPQSTTPTSQGTTGSPNSPGYTPKVPNYLVWSIISLVIFFLPGGIVALVYSVKVDNLLAAGDVAGAQHASGIAKGWNIASTVLFCLWILFFVVLAIVGVSVGLSMGW